jgi:phosphohistidine phosphatase SixA
MLEAMRLVLVRHAQASSGEPDELRALTAEGGEQARLLADRLATEQNVDAVLSSPLLRARQTADAIARATGLETQPHELLAPGATVDDVLLAAATQGDTVVVVGHNPDCEQIAAELGAAAPHGFPPAGYAVIDLPE